MKISQNFPDLQADVSIDSHTQLLEKIAPDRPGIAKQTKYFDQDNHDRRQSKTGEKRSGRRHPQRIIQLKFPEGISHQQPKSLYRRQYIAFPFAHEIHNFHGQGTR